MNGIAALPRELATKDLRGFLEQLRQLRPHDLLHVYRTVNPRHETTAILTKLERAMRFPTLFFHSIAGTSYPTVTNVCGSMARIALAMQCSVAELQSVYADRCCKPIRPFVQSGAPVQERVMTGDAVDLHSLPQFVYHEFDSNHPYITAAIVVARDPETLKSNLSFHRLMILDRTTTAIYIARGKHLDRIYRKYERAGEAMPVAMFLGAHPLWSLGALYSGPEEIEEYDIIGGLMQAPLALVQCVSNDLQVPADAELVLEGMVLPSVRVPEGPFGEFTGYATGEMASPTLKVHAMTSRHDAIFQDIVSGHAEHRVLPVIGIEHRLLEIARSVTPHVTSVRMPVPLAACVALDKHDEAEPKQIIDALTASEVYVKQVVVTDADVEVSDPRQVATAVALHVNADRDVYILSPSGTTELDPARQSDDQRSAKLGIDATIVCAARERITRNSVSRELLDSIDLNELLRPVR